LRDSSSTMASVKNGVSFGSTRTAEEGDGDDCSYSSYLGSGGLGSSSSKDDAMVLGLSPALPLPRGVLANNVDDIDEESLRCLLDHFELVLLPSLELSFWLTPCSGSGLALGRYG
jgi:hypothetical protein